MTHQWKSYSSLPSGVKDRIRELRELYHIHRDVAARAVAVCREMQEVEDRIVAAGAPRIDGMTALDVGSGQNTGHALWLASRCHLTAIDLSVVPEGFDWRAYRRLVMDNGGVRLVKTVGRKVLGYDRRFREQMMRQLQLRVLPSIELLQMDASRMRFPDRSFDLVFSRSAWEHFTDPEAALDEVKRVLRPGGWAHISVHLYTSDSGCHDPRILSGRRGDLPLWPHLRAEWRSHVRPNSYLNELRLGHWCELFERHLPRASVIPARETNPLAQAALSEARAAGDLAAYSDDELLTVALHAVWRRPNGRDPRYRETTQSTD